MHILLLELKRVIKSRITWILLLVAVALSVIISLSVISYAQYTYIDKNGQQIKITGMEAIRANKKQMQPYEGEITIAKLQKALRIYQNVYKQYGENIPPEIFGKTLDPIDPFLRMINKVYPKSGDYYEALSKVSPDEITNFYQQCSETLKNQLEVKYPENKNVLKEAQKLSKKVNVPFVFKVGYSSDAAENLAILIFLLVLICAMIVSPIFSAEYQNGSDDILRCTKNGRAKFAVTKMCASLILTLAMFAVCVLTFVLIVNNAYGWDSLQTSTQILMSALSLVPFTVGQVQSLTIWAGLLTLLAVACFTLFLSTKCRNSTTALIIATVFCALPAVLYSVGRGNIVNLITCILPAGGTGMANSFYYQLSQSTFIQIGSLSAWAPYLMIAAAVIEIPLFFALSIHAYSKHQVA